MVKRDYYNCNCSSASLTNYGSHCRSGRLPQTLSHILDMGEVQVFTNLEEADSAGGTGSGLVACDKDLVDQRSRRAGAVAVSVGDEDAVAHAADAIRRVVGVFSEVDRVGSLQPGIIKLDARDEREDVRSRIKALDTGLAVSLAAAPGAGALGIGRQSRNSAQGFQSGGNHEHVIPAPQDVGRAGKPANGVVRAAAL